MKICILTHDLNPKTGWGRYASDLVAGIKQSGHDVVVLKEAYDQYDSSPVVIRRRLGIFKSAFFVAKLAKDCDVIHALDIYPFGIIAWLASFFMKAQLIVSALGSYSIAPFHSFVMGLFARRVVKSAKRIIAISEYTKRELLNSVGSLNIVVINPGININHFLQESPRDSGGYILSVGALKYRKGYHVSIPAFALAKKKNPLLRYVIVGDQSDVAYFKKLQLLSKELGIADAVEFKKGVSDEQLLKLYREANLFMLTAVNEGYHTEGFGLVFLEAAAAGLPVIGTTNNGIADAVSNGKNGFLVPQEDVDATANAINKVLSDHDLWNSLSFESFTWAKNHTNADMIKKYLDVYLSLGRQ